MKPESTIQLTPGKRVLFLTKDPELIRKQLRGELDLQMKDLSIDDLLDDINTDAMTPAWVCFSHKPEDIAEDAYAGLIVDGKRLFEHDALINGNFEVIVSGYRKGVGSSRETATQCEVWSGIRIAVAASFAPIHAGNNINQGLLMADHAMLTRLQAGEGVSIDEFCKGYDAITQLIIREGGLFPFAKAVAAGEIQVPAPSTPKRPMTMGEKILARHLVGGTKDAERFVKPGDAVVVEVDGGYTHEFTTAQVHYFLEQEYGADYAIKNPQKFAVFEDHLIYADDVARMRPFMGKIQTLRDLQREFQQHTGCRDFSAKDNISPGICHEVAREYIIDPGDFIQATDSHTCMGGVNNALAWGVGATEYANLVHSGFTQVEVSESIRFELVGNLQENVTAKDVMLYILLEYAKPQMTLDRIMEFTGPGLRSLSMDERATLANMATECAARTAIIEADEKTFAWIASMRPDADIDALRARAVSPDPDAEYAGGVHTIDLSTIRPMVAHPGDPDRGIPSDPTNGAFVDQVTDVKIDIAYAGSCTAGKVDDFLFYHQVAKEAVDAGLKVADGVKFYIQFGSQAVETFARENGLLDTFERAGAVVLNPGCGACIGCGPGVSEDSDQVTISAINRNYKGRSGPGKLWLASPLTVAASAFTGHVTAYTPGMFAKELVEA
ncbi:MAG: 3-isopropylmalate/(R)-2-methylmalate dehydratase large subunit [Thermoanaerobaculia bacterium]|jgi:3-isopropylmalate/(R)-2-methylmalate dehydratase large subunit|nr:3-isopropylmalate/(R)-2-methylmalate dehydratase large subunit [Thermoanaerobaculia bacterium]